jgi:hypothetical protein
MEFLDHIKEDYMVPRKCMNKYGVLDMKTLILATKCSNLHTTNNYFWKEMAEIDFELNKTGFKIYNHQLDLSKYKIFNSNFFNPSNKILLKDLNNAELCRYNIIMSNRLESHTYDYDKIREAKRQLNKEILEESQKKICDPRFINPEWDDLEKEIDEYFDNH